MQIAGKEIAPDYGGNYIYTYIYAHTYICLNDVLQAIASVREQLFVNNQKH